MKNTFYIIILFLFIAIQVKATNTEQVDSLYNALIYANDSVKSHVLNELSWELRNSEPEKSIEYGLEAIKLAERYNDYEEIVQAHSFIGVAYRILGNYSEATDYYFKGLELAKKYNLKEQEGYAYINIGNLHIYQEYYFNAIENLIQAQKIAEELGHKRMLGYVYLNIGRAQMLKEEYNEALTNFNKALEIRIEIDQVSGQAVCYKYLGDTYYALNLRPKALSNYKKSLEVVDQSTDKDLHANILSVIAKLYIEEGNYELAHRNAELSMNIAKDIGAKLIIRDNLRILSEIYFNTKNYEKASSNLQCLIKYNDTLFNQQLSEKIFNLEYQIEKQKKQTEIDLLNKDKQIQELELKRFRTSNIALIIILSLITLLFIYVLITSKHRRKQNQLLSKQKEELDQINKTKDKMFLIIGHDLRGPVGNLKTLIEMLLEDEEVVQNKSLLETFSIFMKSIQSVSDLLENLLLWAKSQRGEMSFNPENISLNTIINRNLQLFRSIADFKEIKLQAEMNSNFDVFADKNMLLSVVRNLISNAIKYTPKGGSIQINIIEENGFYKTSVKDTGIGFNEVTAQKILNSKSFYSTAGTNNEAGSGLGLLLSKEFIERNGGHLWAESSPDNGATFYFTIPVSRF